MTFPEPYRVRPARRGDLDAIVELIEARDLADVGLVDQAREETLDDWAMPSVDLSRDSVVIEAPDGSIAAYGLVIALDPTVQVRAVGRVHPRHDGQGLRSGLHGELERRAAARLPAGAEAPLRIDIPEQDREGRDLLTAAGYRQVRSSWLMQMTLAAGDEAWGPVPVPEGVSLRAPTLGEERVMHAVIEESFSEHFAYEPFAFEDWSAWVRDTVGYDLANCVLASSGGVVVGAAVNFTSDDGIGWVGDLGVVPAHRRRGIGRALLLRSFDVLRGVGHHEVRLGVDAQNATGATQLYRGVGMTVRRRFDVYERWLAGA